MTNPMPVPPQRGSAATLMSGTPSSNPTCSFCRQPHTSVSCSKIVNVADRKQALLRVGRCFMCLRRGHRGRECRSGSRCQNCNGRHHVRNPWRTGVRAMTNSSSIRLNPGALHSNDVQRHGSNNVNCVHSLYWSSASSAAPNSPNIGPQSL